MPLKEQAMETLVLIAALTISMVMPLPWRGHVSQECSPETLEKARRAFETSDWNGAAELAETMTGCPEAAGIEAAEILTEVTLCRTQHPRWEKARRLTRQGRFEEACGLLEQIRLAAPGYPNLSGALQEASCDSPMGSITAKLSRVDALIQSERLEEARALLKSILETHPGLAEALERLATLDSGLAHLRSESARLDFAAAKRLFLGGDAEGARNLLHRALESNPDLAEARSLLSRIDARMQQMADKRRQADRLAAEAGELLREGDLAGARDRAAEAISLRGPDPDLLQLRESIDLALTAQNPTDLFASDPPGGTLFEATQDHSPQPFEPPDGNRNAPLPGSGREARLRFAVGSYYSGEYSEATDVLQSLVAENPAPALASLAHFYLGASVAANSMLSSNAGLDDLQTAQDHFRASRRIDSQFSPPLESISPRIQALFSEAVIPGK